MLHQDYIAVPKSAYQKIGLLGEVNIFIWGFLDSLCSETWQFSLSSFTTDANFTGYLPSVDNEQLIIELKSDASLFSTEKR